MKQTKPTIIELDMDNLEDVLRRVDANELKAEDGKAIRALVQSYIHLTQLLQDKNTSLSRLRKMLFGVKTEKTLAVVGSTTDAQTPSSPEADTVTDSAPQCPDSSQEANSEVTAQANHEVQVENDSKSPPQGHGRNGADEYIGAEKITVPHASPPTGRPLPEVREGHGLRFPPRSPGAAGGSAAHPG